MLFIFLLSKPGGNVASPLDAGQGFTAAVVDFEFCPSGDKFLLATATRTLCTVKNNVGKIVRNRFALYHFWKWFLSMKKITITSHKERYKWHKKMFEPYSWAGKSHET
jgi:hypothetical protein